MAPTATDWVTAISSAISTLFIGLGALFAVRQLRIGNRSNQLQAVIRVTDLVIGNPDRVFEARQWVFANEWWLREATLSELSPENRERIESVWRAWDRVGLLVEYKFVEPDPILDMWAYSIKRTNKILAPLLEQRRAASSPQFVHYFSELARRAEKYESTKAALS